MSEYNQYITAVNKIFDYLNKMKVGWNSLDNLSYIDSIEEYKETVVKNLSLFEKPSQQKKTSTQQEEVKK